jgi:hypothetical protein
MEHSWRRGRILLADQVTAVPKGDRYLPGSMRVLMAMRFQLLIRGGLLLGYTAFSPAQIGAGVTRLAGALR